MENPKWRVSELWTYPIKSCMGTSLQEARVGVHGIEHDRRFMLVEESTGMFVAQRSDGGEGVRIKSLRLVAPTVKQMSGGRGYYLEVFAPDMGTIKVFPNLFLHMSPFVRDVRIWGKTHKAAIAETDVNAWFTKFLSRERPGKYQLVMLQEGYVRRAKVGYSQLRFADGYPFLIVSQESLDDLNSRIGGNQPLAINRFRPNIVIKGGRPYDEDRLDRMVINGVDFEGMKLCVRCPITQTDQETGVMGAEPIKTLLTYRSSPYGGKNKVVFARNFNHLSTGTISVGDTVESTEYRERGPCDTD